MQEFSNNIKNIKIMKDIIEDYKKERFTLREWVVYGIVAPAALIVLCILVSSI